MAIIAINSQNTQVYFANSGGTPVKIGGITGISGLDGEAAEIDVSNFDSTAREYIPGLRDNGNFSIDLQYSMADPGQAEISSSRSGAVADIREMSIHFVDGSIITFDCYCSSFDISGQTDEAMKRTAKFRITGAIVETAP